MLGLIFIQVFPSKERFCQTIFLFVEETLVINPLTIILYLDCFRQVSMMLQAFFIWIVFPTFCHQQVLNICANSVNEIQEPTKNLCLDIVVPNSLSAQSLVHGSHSWAGTLNSLNRSRGEHGHLKMQPQKDPWWMRTAKNKPREAKHTFELSWK